MLRAKRHRKTFDSPTADSNLVGKQSKYTKFVVMNIPDVKMADMMVPITKEVKLLASENSSKVMTSPVHQTM